MTYGLGMAVDQGVILMADTRTNAGVDNISTYRKLVRIEMAKGRTLCVASAGNLSTTQRMHSLLEAQPTLRSAKTVFDAVQQIGLALERAHDETAQMLDGSTIDSSATLLVAARFALTPPELYLVYPQGNAIACQRETPFLQIGELKYGKPILDRVLNRATALDEAVKTGLLSFDAAMRSNLSVGMPIDLVVLPALMDQPVLEYRLEPDDAYMRDLSRRWAENLTAARRSIPDPPFMQAFMQAAPSTFADVDRPSTETPGD